MTNQADVDTLLASIDDLRGSWSRSRTAARTGRRRCSGRSTSPTVGRSTRFRRRSCSSPTVCQRSIGSIAPIAVAHSGRPRRASAEPAPPGEPWAQSTGSRYSQVALQPGRLHRQQVPSQRPAGRRRRRRRHHAVVRTGSSTPAPATAWWERGSYSHVRDTTGTRPATRRQDSSKGRVLLGRQADLRRRPEQRSRTLDGPIVTGGRVPGDRRHPPNDNCDDGLRRNAGRSRPQSARPSTTPTRSNPAYQAVTKTWSNGPDWEVWTGSRRTVRASTGRREGLQLAALHRVRPGGRRRRRGTM